jgi:hypothetical protein
VTNNFLCSVTDQDAKHKKIISVLFINFVNDKIYDPAVLIPLVSIANNKFDPLLSSSIKVYGLLWMKCSGE